jgi:hypothetical protein
MTNRHRKGWTRHKKTKKEEPAEVAGDLQSYMYPYDDIGLGGVHSKIRARKTSDLSLRELSYFTEHYGTDRIGSFHDSATSLFDREEDGETRKPVMKSHDNVETDIKDLVFSFLVYDRFSGLRKLAENELNRRAFSANADVRDNFLVEMGSAVDEIIASFEAEEEKLISKLRGLNTYSEQRDEFLSMASVYDGHAKSAWERVGVIANKYIGFLSGAITGGTQSLPPAITSATTVDADEHAHGSHSTASTGTLSAGDRTPTERKRKERTSIVGQMQLYMYIPIEEYPCASDSALLSIPLSGLSLYALSRFIKECASDLSFVYSAELLFPEEKDGEKLPVRSREDDIHKLIFEHLVYGKFRDLPELHNNNWNSSAFRKNPKVSEAFVREMKTEVDSTIRYFQNEENTLLDALRALGTYKEQREKLLADAKMYDIRVRDAWTRIDSIVEKTIGNLASGNTGHVRYHSHPRSSATTADVDGKTPVSHPMAPTDGVPSVAKPTIDEGGTVASASPPDEATTAGYIATGAGSQTQSTIAAAAAAAATTATDGSRKRAVDAMREVVGMLLGVEVWILAQLNTGVRTDGGPARATADAIAHAMQSFDDDKLREDAQLVISGIHTLLSVPGVSVSI